MTASELIEECKRRNINLSLVDGNLHCLGPADLIDAELEAQLKAHKEALIEELQKREADKHSSASYDEAICQVIDELNALGVSMMDYPQATRHRALELELAFTEAANRGEKELFNRLLAEWKACFH
jgi:hypothetical protein